MERTFVKIGTCNETSYNFVPLERNFLVTFEMELAINRLNLWMLAQNLEPNIFCPL